MHNALSMSYALVVWVYYND